jgi:hypothetical protein
MLGWCGLFDGAFDTGASESINELPEGEHDVSRLLLGMEKSLDKFTAALY